MANWHMANWLIWRIDHGKPTMANRHMGNWQMAKRRIPRPIAGKNEARLANFIVTGTHLVIFVNI